MKNFRINERIRVPEIRLVGEGGEQIGIIRTAEALREAKSQGLDLVEIQPNARPPVCRIMNYGKHLYNMNKKRTASRRTQTKEIKLRYNTDSGDYQVKMSKIITFLSRGDKVKVSMRFRGREMQHRELGLELLKKMQKELEEHAVVDNAPRLEGRQLSMLLSPSKALLAQIEKQKQQKKAAEDKKTDEATSTED